MRYQLAILAAITAMAALPSATRAAEVLSRRPLAAARVAKPPTIDGDLSDEAWKTAPLAEGFADSQRGTPAQDATRAWLLYDDQRIYVAFKCTDSQPEGIVARETIRDSLFGSDNVPDDHVLIRLDPFNTTREEDFARFAVTAAGTPSASITGGRASKTEWKGDWNAAARRTPDGWTAEISFPWQILNYPSAGKAITMGLNFVRWQHRTRVRSIWSDEGTNGFHEMEGRWEGVQPPARSKSLAISALPYMLTGYDRDRLAMQMGMDLRSALTPELTAVATINPDFGTIEGAVEGINFSRSERWVEDRRPFFLEGRDNYGAGNPYGTGIYFYPNRIQAVDAGLKLFGKVSHSDTLGLLGTVDWGNRSDLIANWRHDITATCGAGLFLSHMDAVGDRSTLASFSLGNRWGKFSVDGDVGLTQGTGSGGGERLIEAIYQDKGHFTVLRATSIAPNFRAADGLVWFNDTKGVSVYHECWREWLHGPVRALHADFGPSMEWHFDNRPFRTGGSGSLGIDLRTDWSVGIGAGYSTFDGQIDNTYSINLGHGGSNRFKRWGVGLNFGRLASRHSTFTSPSFNLRLLRKLDVAYGGAIQDMDGHLEQHLLTLNYEISPTRSFGGRIVREASDTNWYLSYRDSGHKGTEVFCMVGDPNARAFTNRALVKVVFTR